MTHKVLKSETTYHARAFDVKRDEILYPDGRKVTFDVVVHGGAVAMVPVDAGGNIWFVRQYRHSAGKLLLELPAGTLERGEDPEACAQRELREEIGMGAADVAKLADFFLAPGYSTERMWIFLATGLSPEKLEGDEDEDLEIIQLTPEQAFAAIQSGEIEDAKTIVGLFLAKEFLLP